MSNGVKYLVIDEKSMLGLVLSDWALVGLASPQSRAALPLSRTSVNPHHCPTAGGIEFLDIDGLKTLG